MAQPPPGVQRVPLFLKTSEGGAGGIAAHAKPDPPLIEGARQDKAIRPHRRADAGVRGPRHTPIAKYEQLCYSTLMKSATGPLLFLGACRIRLALWANHRASPCGRGAEGTTQGARPSEEDRGRSECRFDTSSLEPLRLVSVSLSLVTAPFEGRRQASRIVTNRLRVVTVVTSRCYGLPPARAPLLLLAPLPASACSTRTPSPVPGAAGWPPTERPMNCVTPTERRAVDFRGVTDIRTVKRPRSWPHRARIGGRLKALSSASQTKPSRRSWRRGG